MWGWAREEATTQAGKGSAQHMGSRRKAELPKPLSSQWVMVCCKACLYGQGTHTRHTMGLYTRNAMDNGQK